MIMDFIFLFDESKCSQLPGNDLSSFFNFICNVHYLIFSLYFLGLCPPNAKWLYLEIQYCKDSSNFQDFSQYLAVLPRWRHSASVIIDLTPVS